jgi:hypothetical protein
MDVPPPTLCKALACAVLVRLGYDAAVWGAGLSLHAPITASAPLLAACSNHRRPALLLRA